MQILKQLFIIESRRYKRKGIKNIIIGVGLFMLIMWGSCHYGSYIFPQHIQNRQIFVIWISFVIHFGTQIGFFFIYAPGYWNSSSWLQKYRINPKTSRSWERPDWPETRRKIISNILINFCIVYPIIVILATYLDGLNLRFNHFPNTVQMIIQLIVMYAIDDFFFYWFHRLGHQNKYLYTHHKVHHQYDNPFTFTAQYATSLEYITVNMLPPALAVMLLGSKVHCFTFFMWQIWKVFISVQNHSGYELPFSPIRIIPLSIQPSYHDFHHSKNVGNFSGSLIIWDFLCKTSNQQYYDQYTKQC